MKLFIAIALSCIPLHAGTLIKFDIKETKSDTKATEKSGANVSPDANSSHIYKLELFLDSKQIVYKKTDSLLVLDLDSDKMGTYVSKNKGVSYVKSSMYSVIAYRERERQNRKMLGNVLKETGAKMKDELTDPVQMDHIFSTKLEKAAKLERTIKDGVVSFSYQGNAMLSYSTSGSVLDNSQQSQFIVALKYNYGIHPDILKELASLGKCPERLEFTMHGLEKISYELKMTKILPKQDSPVGADLSKLKLDEFIDDKRAAPALKKLQEHRKLGFKNVTASYLTKATKLVEAKKPLDAFLCMMAYCLATSENIPRDKVAMIRGLGADPLVLKMMQSLNPTDDAGLKKSVKAFTELIDQADEGKAILHIFRANMYEGLNQHQSALDDFWVALGSEPMIVGAWKNAGDIYLTNYNANEAWQCWQIAEGIFPEHKFLNDISERELRLRNDYPGYFLPQE